MSNQQIAGFPHGMHLNVFVCAEIPRDQLSFREIDTPHTYKGVRNYKYRTVINRIDIPCAGWIIEDICVCESVRLCIPWAQVSVPTTCPPSLLPSFNPSFCPSFHSPASVIKQRLVWHESKRGDSGGRYAIQGPSLSQGRHLQCEDNTFSQVLYMSTILVLCLRIYIF